MGAGCRLLAVAYAQVLHGNFLFLDDQGYDRIGWSLAQAWHMNTFPSPGSVAYAGTLSYLYYVVVAAVYFVFGHHWIMVKVIGALLSALSVPAAAAVGDSLGGRRLASAAAWLDCPVPQCGLLGVNGPEGWSVRHALARGGGDRVPAAGHEAYGQRRSAYCRSLPVPPGAGCHARLVMMLVPAIDWGRRQEREFPLRGRTRLPVLLVGLPVLLVVSGVLAARYLPILDASTASEAAPPRATGQ